MSLAAPIGILDSDQSNNSSCDANRVEYADVVIKKVVQGPASATSFDFGITNTTPSRFGLSNENEQSFEVPPPINPYVVSETTMGGLVLWDIFCTDDSGGASVQIGLDQDFDFGDTSVTITPKAGEQIQCDFYNVTSALDVTKDDGSASYTPGGSSTYSITVLAGFGGFDAYGVNLSDTLPAGAQLDGSVSCTSTGTASCTPISAVSPCVTLSGPASASEVQMNNCGFIPADGSSSLVYTVPVIWDAGTSGDKTNTAQVFTASQVSATSDSDTNVQQSVSDLSAQKTAAQASYTAGSTTQFQVVVSNSGPSDALGAQLLDPMPNGVTSATWTCDVVASAPVACPTGGAGAGTGDLDSSFDLAVGQSLVFDVVQTIDPAFDGALINIATIQPTGGATDPNSGNNRASAQVLPGNPVMGEIAVLKTTDRTNVNRLDAVDYRIMVKNVSSRTLTNFDVQDIMPAGFYYQANSAVITRDGIAQSQFIEPSQAGRILTWRVAGTSGVGGTGVLDGLLPDEALYIDLTLRVGGVLPTGSYPNKAQALTTSGTAVSAVSEAVVQLAPDMFECSTVVGQVFSDDNHDGYQNPGEAGIPGSILYDAAGRRISADQNGRYHIPCTQMEVLAATYGSNFILKLDTGSLPDGASLTTENPRLIRVTQGKMTEANFGVARQRDISVSINHCSFLPDQDQLAPANQSAMTTLAELLRGLENPRLTIRMTQHWDQQSLGARQLAGFKALAMQSVSGRQLETTTRVVTLAQGETLDCTNGQISSPLPATTASAQNCPVLPTLYFGFDQFDIDVRQGAKVQNIASTIAASECSNIVVEGHTDLVGTQVYNDILGSKRAQVVAAMLIELGVDSNAISVVTLGARQPSEPAFAVSIPIELNRRVQVKLRQ